MASSPAPPVIPISNPSVPAAAAAADPSVPPVATPAFRLFLSRLSDTARRSLSDRRPWSELLDRTAFSRPDSIPEATARIRKNLAYFRVNYILLLAAALAISLLSQPASLLVLLGLLAAWSLLYLFRPADPPLVILGRAFSDRETLAGLSLLTVLVMFLTSVGSLIISAIMAGAAVVCTHGALRVPEDLFLDDQEPGGATTGFLSSFLGGAVPSVAAPATATIVAARV